MYDDTQLNEALLANTDIELKELIFKDEPNQELPNTVKRFLARAGLTPQDLQNVGLEIADIEPMLKASWLKYLRLSQIDNAIFKLLMLSAARAWPRSKSLLFTSPWLLRQAYMTNDFIKGVQSVALPLGLGVTYASLAMDWVNYGSCADTKRGVEPLLMLLGASKRSQILSLLLSTGKMAYVPSLLFGLPLVWGSIRALMGALDARPLTRKRAKMAIETLQNYQPHLWQDFGRWLLPFSILERHFNQLVRALIFDGRNIISADERYHMTIALTQLARNAQGFTQLNAMDGLAEIINGIALKDFSYLNERFESDTKAAVLFSKHQAHATLRKLANNYQLELNQSKLRPLIRYMYANYLLWYIGQPATISLRPLFWAVEGAKAYATLSIITALVRAAVEAIQQLVKKKQCESAGKMYSFITAIGDYACRKCPDLVAYADSHNDTSCFNAFMRHSKPVQDILKAIRRFKLTEIKTLNLVVHRLNSAELGQVLQALNAKNATFDNLEIFWEPSLNYSTQTTKAIIKGLPALQAKQLKLRTSWIDDVLAKAIGNTLSLGILNLDKNGLTDKGLVALNGYYPPSLRELRINYNQLSLNEVDLKPVFYRKLEHLSLYGNKIPLENFRKLYPHLKTSNLVAFYPPSGEYNITEYIQHLPWLTLQRTSLLPGYYDSQAVTAFTEAISHSRVTNLGLGFAEMNITDPQQFAERIMLPSLIDLEILFTNIPGDVFIAMGPLLNRTTSLQLLSLANVPITDKGLAALGQYLPASTINALRLNIINVTDIGIQALMQGAQYAHNLRELELGTNNLKDVGVSIVANYIPPSLKRLELFENQITGAGARYLVDSLARHNVSTLGLSSNQLGDTGAINLAQRLKDLPSLTHLELGGNGITDTGAIALAKDLHHSSLSMLRLHKNTITDEGGIRIAHYLIKSACQRPINLDRNTARAGTPRTNLTSLLLIDNLISHKGSQALCKAMITAQIPLEELRYEDDTWQWTINTSLIDVKTCASSSRQSNIDSAATQMFIIPKENRQQATLSAPTLTNIAVLGALGLSAWYIANSLATWWSSKPKKYLPKEEIEVALIKFNEQIQLLSLQLNSFDKYNLNRSQKKFLDYLKANLADSKAEQAWLQNRTRVTAEQLQTVGDELENIVYGAEELQEELINQPRTPSSINRLGLFAIKPTSAYQSTGHNYYTYAL